MPEASETSLKTSRRLRCGRAGSRRSAGPWARSSPGCPSTGSSGPAPARSPCRGRGRDSSGHEQVELPVPVVVEERCSPSPSASPGSARPALRRHVLEAPAHVAVEDVLPVVGDEEVGPAVVVVVAGAHRRGPAGAAQAGLVRDVGEGAVVVVAVEAVRGRLAPRPGLVLPRAPPRAASPRARARRSSRRCRSR